jgi:hypothetical protein
MFSTFSHGFPGFKNYFEKPCYYSQINPAPWPHYYFTGAFTGCDMRSLEQVLVMDPACQHARTNAAPGLKANKPMVR